MGLLRRDQVMRAELEFWGGGKKKQLYPSRVF